MEKFKKEELGCLTELTFQDTIDVYGGAATVGTIFWYDLAYLGGIVAQGLSVFATQGGRNAGLCVR